MGLARASSIATIAATGMASRAFLYGTQHVETEGLSEFLSLLESRRKNRSCGLLTVSNHKSVMDDPLIWGTLPLSYMLSPENMRHALGSADICFTKSMRSAFFSAGQVHPTHRLHKSPQGGLFQPVVAELVSLLSAPSSAWVHIFPEGRVHQHPVSHMRYFKWGVSRLMLEPPDQPTFVPMFIDGFDQIMHESRKFPRFLPRLGKSVKVVYGDVVPDTLFQDVRDEWRRMRESEGARAVEESEVLRSGPEAVALRIETTKRIREEIVKLRRKLGYPEEEEAAGMVETYKICGMRKEGRLSDGSWEKDT